MEGASSSLMGFGDGAVLPPLMIMPLINPSPTSPLKPHSTPNDNEGNVALLSNTNTAKNTPTTATTSMVPFVDVDDTKAKIMSHPHYPRLLSAYVSCHKVGAPPEVVAKLEEARVIGRSGMDSGGVIGEDPALDQFMEAYCEMLTKYEEELSKPFKEAMVFLSRVESQFKSLTVTSSTSSLIPSGGSEYEEKNGSSDEDVAAGETFIDPQADESELKGQLLRKYSGYLGSLRKEFLKKRKKGKLPKEARQQLLDWWTRHYKWPYPSESQKVALAESTGLDQKQINNWFINQRKRHWKPSEEMQFVVMDAGAHPTHYYLENGFSNPFSFDCGQTLF